MPDLDRYREPIAAACADLGVERVDVFGSAIGPDFDAASDVDVIARFDRRPGKLFARYFELKERLERALNRPVDLLLEDSMRNPYLREAIERSRVSVYES